MSNLLHFTQREIYRLARKRLLYVAVPIESLPVFNHCLPEMNINIRHLVPSRYFTIISVTENSS